VTFGFSILIVCTAIDVPNSCTEFCTSDQHCGASCELRF